MARGGFRAGAGRPKGTTYGQARVETEAAKAAQTPLEYMLSVMNDPKADNSRRDRMAVAAAPFVHSRPGDAPKGKKEERQEAAERVHGKYAVPQPPRHAVN